MYEKVIDFHLKSAPILEQIIEKKISSRAIIIEGKKGLGKKDLILSLSGKILSSYDKVKRNIHPDFLLIDSVEENILVDDIDSIDQWVDRPPFESENKIIFINNSHNMGDIVQNKLLKLLEEPPSYLILFLSVNNVNILLPTVRSRCLTFQLTKLPDSLISEIISDEIDSNYKSIIIESLDGSMRNIDFFNGSNCSKLYELSGYLIERNIQDLEIINNLIEELINETNQTFLIEELSSIIMVRLKKFIESKSINEKNIESIINLINELSSLSINIKKYNLNIKLSFEELILNYFLKDRKSVNQVV
jgi:DNA polymerase-3 subunit delta'|tara:strand:+ start:352 stop:1266 length:915 start_codon:yes stop_codon:yes gene_type:complete